MDTTFGRCSIILDFRFPQGWAEFSEDDQFHFALSDHLQSLLAPQHTLSTLHNELEPRGDQLQRLFHLLCSLRCGMPPTKSSHQDGQGVRKARLRFLMSHSRKNSVRAKVIGNK